MHAGVLCMASKLVLISSDRALRYAIDELNGTEEQSEARIDL